jgi:benzodiazapine receptor
MDSNYTNLLYYIIIVFALISLGGNINSVTSNLVLPSFYPPVSLFGTVWFLLFILFGFFLYYATDSLQLICIAYFTIVLLWTPLFVYTKSTAVGFYYLFFIVLLTIILLYMSIKTYPHPYYWLLIPQLIWTSFATIIAYSLYKLN